jgi:hypothetical protein
VDWWVDGWVGGRVDGWVDGWTGGWVRGWVDRMIFNFQLKSLKALIKFPLYWSRYQIAATACPISSVLLLELQKARPWDWKCAAQGTDRLTVRMCKACAGDKTVSRNLGFLRSQHGAAWTPAGKGIASICWDGLPLGSSWPGGGRSSLGSWSLKCHSISKEKLSLSAFVGVAGTSQKR